ncbi:MAG: hypothetical protein ACLQIB_55605 [Isosphaeraceae bacterium]
MIAKIGIKAWSLLAGAVFAMIVVVGCNPEEPAPTTTPTAGPKAGAAPSTAPKAVTPPATKEETKKP